MDRYIYGYCRIATAQVNVQVAALIMALEPPEAEGVFNGEIIANMKFIRGPDDYYSCLDAEKIWRGATSADEFQLAIDLAAKAIAVQSGTTVKTHSVGTKFVEALQRVQGIGRGSHSS